MTQKNEFEMRLAVIDHMAHMLLEMAEFESDQITEEEEEEALQQYSEVAGHLLDSMGFKPSNSENGVTFTADFALIDPEKYITDFLEENP
jgi:hypothetical protein